MAAENKKQGSGEDFPETVQTNIKYLYSQSLQSSLYGYLTLLEKGVCEEQARFLLPQGAIVNWFWTGSLAAFARFYNQRTDSHAQKEIQDLAKQVGEIIEPLYPISWKALTSK